MAEKMDVTAATLVGELMKNGVMATLNDRIDFDTASIIAEEFGFEVEEEEAQHKTQLLKSTREITDKATERPPVVAVMGHVDHGKTTLLDAIRDADQASGEAGGITQHISAYQIKYKERLVTFLDTPGHEAFSALREHGAALTDVAVIVVAANDGVMPQTKEAITFAQQSGVKIVVAINKIDAPGADPNKVMTQLSEHQLIPEQWGGDTVMVEVSALKKQNIDELLEMVLLTADVEDHKAEKNVPAEGIVIESHMAPGKGPVATVLVEHGVLRVGSFLVAGGTHAKIKALENDRGETITEAGPSCPATIVGFKNVPVFGNRFQEVETEREARKTASSQKSEAKKESTNIVKSATGADILSQIDTEKTSQTLNVIIKADVQGSLESLSQSLENLGDDEVGIKVVASGVGDINESDISAAEASNSRIYGFNVGISTTVKKVAARTGVPIKIYSVIYELLDDAKEALEDSLAPEIIESEVGTLKVKGVFRTTQKQIICGGEVTKGKLIPQSLARLYRDDEELGAAEITSVQRGKDPVKEAFEGDMCGLELRTEIKINLKEADRIVCIQREERKRKL